MVQHAKLIDILRETDNEKNIGIIKNFYWNRSANIEVEGETTETLAIQQRVRQGCVLFNLYSGIIFKEALNEVDQGITVNGELMKSIRYADYMHRIVHRLRVC